MSEVNRAENEGKDNQKSDKEEHQIKEEEKKSHGKYVFECQRCGQCCEKKEKVVVSLTDLERWSKDVTLPSLYPYLTVETIDGSIQISMKTPEGGEGEAKKGCPLYDAENKLCSIYFSMPLYCKSFPLGYDGEGYFLKDKNCPGVGRGGMSDEKLEEARNAARDDFEARVSTALLLPVVHGLAIRFLLDQSKKRIDELTDEQKEKLKEIFGSAKDNEIENEEKGC